jgi:hypothetical protein
MMPLGHLLKKKVCTVRFSPEINVGYDFGIGTVEISFVGWPRRKIEDGAQLYYH